MFNSNEDEKMKKKKKDLVLKTYLDGDGKDFNNEDLAFLLKKLKNICIEMRKDVISRKEVLSATQVELDGSEIENESEDQESVAYFMALQVEVANEDFH